VRHPGSFANRNRRTSSMLSSADVVPIQEGATDDEASVTLGELSTYFAGAGGVAVATTATQGKAKVDHNSAGDPVALTSAGHGLAADPHPQYALDAHIHVIADTTGLQAVLDGKSAVGHAHSADDTTTGTFAAARLPVATTVARGVARVDHSGAGDPVVLTQAGHAADADPHPQYTLDSEKGAASGLATLDGASKLTASQLPLGSTGTTACAGNDSRLSDARTPMAHQHNALDVNAGTLDIGRIPTGSTAMTVCIGNDARLSDARTPTSHSITGVQHTFPGGTTTFLRADGTFATPSGGSDPWTILKLAADFSTTSATAVDVTGLGFTPSANTSYMIEGILFLRTATATVNPRAGFAWPSAGMTDGVMSIDEAQTATTQLMARGNSGAALLMAVGGLPNTTQSWPAFLYGAAVVGAGPSGTLRVQLASETAGTSVTIKAGSFLRYRTY
jgi:hypothetical protein